MSFPEWSLVVGSVLTISLTIGPWLIKVHSKLAVISSKIGDVCEKIDRQATDHRRLWETCSRHQARLDTHQVQLTHIAERLRGE